MSEENLLKLIENTQHNQRVQAIVSGVGTGFSLLATSLVVFKAFKPARLSPKIRLIRLKKRRTIFKDWTDWKLRKIDLEIITAQQEAFHEAELAQFGSGLSKFKEEMKETITTQTQGLKEQGKEFLNKKAKEIKDQVKGEFDKLKDKLNPLKENN